MQLVTGPYRVISELPHQVCQKLYLSVIISFHIFNIEIVCWQVCNLSVLFSEMTSLSSIFKYCKINKRVPSKKDRKASSVSHNHLWHIFINHTLESSVGQTINFLYNLNSIVNCCIGPKCGTCNNVFDNDFWLIFITRPENLVLTNK